MTIVSLFRSLAPNFYDMEKRPTVKKKRNFSETEMETLVSLVDSNRQILLVA